MKEKTVLCKCRINFVLCLVELSGTTHLYFPYCFWSVSVN